MEKNIPAAERLIFAMDVPDSDSARRLAGTLGDAVHFYADYIVIGRPIRDAEDPRAAAEAIQATVAGVFA